MRRPSPFLRRDETASMEAAMTPMIDVVFLLLVFFIWTASFQIVEQLLPSQMQAQTGEEPNPLDPPPPPSDFERVVIRIRWDGQEAQYQINQVPLASVDELRGHLVALAEVKQDATLILHPDQLVPLGDVIAAYDEAKLAGFVEVAFAVNPPGSR